jgi:ABC-type multidrug transport system fused ATPase/permease subunit
MRGLLRFFKIDRPLRRFLGRRFVTSSAATFTAGIAGGIVDYCFALAIQLFLFSMGITGALLGPLSHPALGRPLVIGAILVALGALRAAMLFTQGFASGVAQEQASARVRMAAILGILPQDDAPRPTAAEAIYTYSELSSKSALYLSTLVRFLASVLQTAVLACAMIWMSWTDSLIAVGLLSLAAVLLLALNVRIGRVAKLSPIIWSESLAAMESASRNWFYIRIKHIDEKERERLCHLNADVTAIGFRLRKLSELSPGAVNLIGVLLLALLANTRAWVTHTPAPLFLGFLYVFLRFAQGLGDGVRGASSLVEYKPYFEQLRKLVRAAPANTRDVGAQIDREVSSWGGTRIGAAPPARPLPAPRPEDLGTPGVTLRDVSFRYDEGGPWIVSHFNADILPGSQLAIVGPSGCGKSTLLSLILGFLKPDNGVVEISGSTPEQFYARHSEYVGYVGPEPYVVSGTVRDNVLFGSRSAYSDAQIQRALRQAALWDVIESLPAGLDTPLRHHDIALSMGQRQRLALARALVSDPVILILDEASANLDDATEEAIATSIKSLKGNMTTIIVSHKLGLVKHADQVINLANQSAGSARDSQSAS